MRYNTVKIYPENGRWVVQFYRDENDRVLRVNKPSPLGFYHYPEAMGKEEAFGALKDAMIRAHAEEVNKLLESLEKLKCLEL